MGVSPTEELVVLVGSVLAVLGDDSGAKTIRELVRERLGEDEPQLALLGYALLFDAARQRFLKASDGEGRRAEVHAARRTHVQMLECVETNRRLG